MNFFDALLRGLCTPLTQHVSPLYRYPFRNSGEGLRSDYKRIGEDIKTQLDTMEQD